MDHPNLPRLTVTALCNTTREGYSETVFRSDVSGVVTRAYFPVNRAGRFSKNAFTPSM